MISSASSLLSMQQYSLKVQNNHKDIIAICLKKNGLECKDSHLVAPKEQLILSYASNENMTCSALMIGSAIRNFIDIPLKKTNAEQLLNFQFNDRHQTLKITHDSETIRIFTKIENQDATAY